MPATKHYDVSDQCGVRSGRALEMTKDEWAMFVQVIRGMRQFELRELQLMVFDELQARNLKSV